MPRALARAWEDEQNLLPSARSFVLGFLRGLRLKQKRDCPQSALAIVLTFVFTLTFLVCIPYYLAESLTSKEGTIVIGVVAGLLGVVAVLLVAALVAVIHKHRNKSDVTGAVTLPLVRDNVPGPG